MKQANDYSSTSKALSGVLPIPNLSNLKGPSSTGAFALPLSTAGDLPCFGACPSLLVSCSADAIIIQLLLLDAEDPKKDIRLFINFTALSTTLLSFDFY
nr:ATP-dependent Clp protease proteolytic subunit 4, chloroplastic [Tanacetum cinerariifolium]